jgi:hypothetical protein
MKETPNRASLELWLESRQHYDVDNDATTAIFNGFGHWGKNVSWNRIMPSHFGYWLAPGLLANQGQKVIPDQQPGRASLGVDTPRKMIWQHRVLDMTSPTSKDPSHLLLPVLHRRWPGLLANLDKVCGTITGQTADSSSRFLRRCHHRDDDASQHRQELIGIFRHANLCSSLSFPRASQLRRPSGTTRSDWTGPPITGSMAHTHLYAKRWEIDILK